MKRKLAGVLTAAVLMAQPFTSLAAGSMPSTPSPSRDNMSSSTQSMISGELNNGAAPTALQAVQLRSARIGLFMRMPDLPGT